MWTRPFGRGFSPWREMARLQRDMDRLLSRSAGWPGWSVAPSFPAMNVWTHQEGAIVTAELPGVDPAEIDISVQDDTLTVRGSRVTDEAQEGQTYHRRERGSGSFTRSFQLPFSAEANQVTASYEKGVLSITLPRAEADQPKKIAVQAG